MVAIATVLTKHNASFCYSHIHIYIQGYITVIPIASAVHKISVTCIGATGASRSNENSGKCNYGNMNNMDVCLLGASVGIGISIVVVIILAIAVIAVSILLFFRLRFVVDMYHLYMTSLNTLLMYALY